MNIKEPGIYKYKGQKLEYDAILPDYVHKRYLLLFPGLMNEIDKHRKKYYFKFHQHSNHMASSQVANINLFLPILLHPIVNEVFRQLKFDFNILSTKQLFSGFRIEFWDGTNGDDKGLLGEKVPDIEYNFYTRK